MNVAADGLVERVGEVAATGLGTAILLIKSF